MLLSTNLSGIYIRSGRVQNSTIVRRRTTQGNTKFQLEACLVTGSVEEVNQGTSQDLEGIVDRGS